MTGAILIALLAGVVIALSRTVNGTLGRKVGAMRSSFWNHIVGFGFMTAVLAGVAVARGLPSLPAGAPITAWSGGALGVVFVAINSHVIVRLGASRTTGLVVGAQMLTGVAVSSIAHRLDAYLVVRLAGAGLVIGGIVLANISPARAAPTTPQGLPSVPK